MNNLPREIKNKIHSAGLSINQCSPHHYHIKGGLKNKSVNVWPFGKTGFNFSVGNEKAIRGTIEDAIRLAGRKTVSYTNSCDELEDVPWEDSRETAKEIPDDRDFDDYMEYMRDALLAILGTVSLPGMLPVEKEQQIYDIATKALSRK